MRMKDKERANYLGSTVQLLRESNGGQLRQPHRLVNERRQFQLLEPGQQLRRGGLVARHAVRHSHAWT